MSESGIRLPDASRLDVALDRLVTSGRLTADQATAVRGEFASTADVLGSPPAAERLRTGSALPAPTWRVILPEVGGYVGAAFVAAAAAVLVGPHWETLSRAAQVLLFAVPAALLIGAGVLIARNAPGGWNPHAGSVAAGRRRVVAVLLTVGAGLGAAATGVAVGEDATDRAIFTAAAVLLIGAYLFCRSALIQLAALVAVALGTLSWTAWWAQERWGMSNPSVAIGLALGVVAAGWAAATMAGWFDERRLGTMGAYTVGFVAAEILAVGSESGLVATAGYLALTGLAVSGFVGYVRTRFVGHLIVGVVALATVVPQAVLDYTGGAFGAGGALLLVGLSIVGASLIGFRVRRR
ncbi:hypothetical protein [Nakamurella sp.]|uniref:hypothetical protein n=1 Tax=Nakamurella sp. TaxID=1869182 RepID=UPI00378393C2